MSELRWFLIHTTSDREVFGILEADDYPGDDAGIEKLSKWSTDITAEMVYHMRKYGGLKLGEWIWETISQAEYETYRDLHGFKVVNFDE